MTRILLVDDTEENRDDLRVLLSAHGFSIEAARHGAEAMVLARKRPPDLVISDLLMPVMDGYTLLRLWRTDERLSNIPFIVHTATYTDAADERLALTLGADAFILKPADPETFIRQIRDVLDEVPATVRAATDDPEIDDKSKLELFNANLVRRLEEKTLQLEEANRRLQQQIRERTASEESLREANSKLRDLATVLDGATDAIVVRDLEHRVLFWNRSAERLYGWSSEEALGRSVFGLVCSEGDAFDEAMRSVLESGEWDGEMEHVGKNGESRPVDTRWTLVRDDDGNPASILSINTDITERKQLETNFLRAQRMESIGTLAGGLAHDFNNLLAPIIMGVDYLKRVETREKVLAVVDNIEKSANRGTAIVRQVLSFARGVEVSRETLHVEAVVREIDTIITSTFPKSISFSTAVSEKLWTVDGDPTQLTQVLLNLCLNARDAMPAGGKLLVSARNVEVDQQRVCVNGDLPPGRYVKIDVTDEGTGISPEIQDRIFEPFFTTKRSGLGSGLGLSTVLGIVRSHGGYIDLVSGVPGGTTISVYLPGMEAREDEAPATEAPAVARGNGELILMVDDEPSILEIVQETLDSYGYRTLVAENGVRALELYGDHRDDISLVITDMAMPRMDGAALIAELKRIDPAAKIIATSGLEGVSRESSGATAFLKKPFSADQLLTLLQSVLTGSGD